jgi:D-alanyl-D-alanine carboxypeptidase
MLNEAVKYSEFTEITQLSSYTVTYTHADGTQVSTVLTATDEYLTGEASAPKNVTVLGGKTGTTSAAGNCLALVSQNAYGKPFVSVITGASSKAVLYQEMNSLLQNIN